MTRFSYLRTIFIGAALYATATVGASAQTFTTLAYFATQGSAPFSSLIQGRDGNLFGTASTGGAHGQGTVFRVSPSGTLTAVHGFCEQTNCTDGAYPTGALVLGIDGSLYGTSQDGGASGLGTVFKVAPNGAFLVLHSFDGTDGSFPAAGLVLASDGNFYGTTSEGGTSSSCGGCGTVFRISPTGTLTTLHSFDETDGAFPEASLVQGNNSDLYGTTIEGGTSNACYGNCGTVFKIAVGGKFTSLHSFSFTDGYLPYAPLVQVADGAFYGTTLAGGNGAFGFGTVFKISPQGSFATVHKFDGNDGGGSDSGLMQGTDGKLYGESPDAGDGVGNILSLSPPRTLTTVYLFPAESGGGGNTALAQATDGKFYGTYGSPGSIFSLDTSLDPFVAFVIPTGKVGKAAQILGQGLTGATSVTFNGVLATSFTAVSDTYMTAVIPSGATTGSVVVTTPTGTLTSNVNFRIAK
jgi:uncharacterized repeat protein (TIGR03803 family)